MRGVSVGTGGPLSSKQLGQKKRAHFTVWPREQMFHMEVPFSKMP